MQAYNLCLQSNYYLTAAIKALKTVLDGKAVQFEGKNM